MGMNYQLIQPTICTVTHGITLYMISVVQTLQSDALDPECICSACVPQTTWEKFPGIKNCVSQNYTYFT